MMYPPHHYYQQLSECLEYKVFSCSVLSGKFNIVKTVSVNFLLLAREWLRSKVGSVLPFAFFFSLQPWKYSSVISAWMQGEWGCRFSLQCYLLQVTDIIQLFFKLKKSYIALSHLLGYLRGMCRVLFSYTEICQPRDIILLWGASCWQTEQPCYYKN